MARECGWSDGRAAKRDRVAEPIAHCGELGGKDVGTLIAKAECGRV